MMHRVIISVIALGFVVLGCVMPEEAANAAAATRGQTRPPTELERARAILEARHSGKIGSEAQFGATVLAGYNFHEEIHPPSGAALVFVSLHRAGSVWLFDSEGNLTQQLPTGEILAVSSRDVDGDGTLEFVTEELDGSGTGIRMEGFHLYGVAAGQLVPLWSGESRVAISPPPGANDTPESKIGFVRFDDRGEAGQPMLQHVVWDHERCLFTQTAFELSRSNDQLQVTEVGKTTSACPGKE